MTDILQRLRRALPALRTWVDQVMVDTAAIARPVAGLPLDRLPEYFPPEVLSAAEIAIVSAIPFPPVSALGLPEFEAMATMSMAGITFRNRFFVLRGNETESLCAHELVHVVQWGVLDVDAFLLTYGLGVIQCGYEASPLEAIAFAFQRAFDGGQPVPDAVQKIADHARSTRDEAAAFFNAHGLPLGA